MSNLLFFELDSIHKALEDIQKRLLIASELGEQKPQKCTCTWEWPEYTVGDPDNTANIAIPDPACPVHAQPKGDWSMKEKELIEAYEDYIKILGEELNDMSGLALVHGWKSSRVEAGKLAREKIAARQEIEGSTGTQIPVPVPTCQCVTKPTGVTNMRLIFIRRGCPVHGKDWQA